MLLKAYKERIKNMEKSKTKKIVTITLDVLFALFMVCIIMFAISNINAKKNNKIPNLFGNGYMTVVSDSMDGKHEDSFKVGDLITVKLANKDGSNMDNLQVKMLYLKNNFKIQQISVYIFFLLMIKFKNSRLD